MSPRRGHVYVVRTWLEPGPSGGAWRASVRDGVTTEVRHFADAAALVRFLEAASAPRPEGAAAKGDEAPA